MLIKQLYPLLLALFVCLPSVVEAKRAAPVKTSEIVFGNSTLSQSKKTCGLVLLKNNETGKIIRKIRFYTVTYDLVLEKDVQDVWLTDFFRSSDDIWARDEKGRIYKMLLKTMIPKRVYHLSNKEFEALKDLK